MGVRVGVTDDDLRNAAEMEPIPETVEAIDEYGPFSARSDLVEQLRDAGRRVRAVAPTCVGMSVAMLQHGVTFTLVASDETTGVLDGAQYLDGGPCVEAAETGTLLHEDDLLSEERWRVLASAAGSRGVASSLSLPVVERGLVIGSINLYGASATTFTGHVEALAEVLGAWAAGAITNADLSFDSLDRARAAPALLREETVVSIAAGVLASASASSVAAAQERLRQAALRAGVPVAVLAEAINAAFRGH